MSLKISFLSKIFASLDRFVFFFMMIVGLKKRLKISKQDSRNILLNFKSVFHINVKPIL